MMGLPTLWPYPVTSAYQCPTLSVQLIEMITHQHVFAKDIKTALLTAPLDMSVNLHVAAINTGLRSEIGLAVIMFPPMACKQMGHIQYAECKLFSCELYCSHDMTILQK